MKQIRYTTRLSTALISLLSVFPYNSVATHTLHNDMWHSPPTYISTIKQPVDIFPQLTIGGLITDFLTGSGNIDGTDYTLGNCGHLIGWINNDLNIDGTIRRNNMAFQKYGHIPLLPLDLKRDGDSLEFIYGFYPDAILRPSAEEQYKVSIKRPLKQGEKTPDIQKIDFEQLATDYKSKYIFTPIGLPSSAEANYMQGINRPGYFDEVEYLLNTGQITPHALVKIISDEKAHPQLKAKAEIIFATQTSAGQIHDITRMLLCRVIENNQARPEDRAKATLLLARMDCLGEGLLTPNYEEARKNYIALTNNEQALAADREAATFRLAEMDFYGQGLYFPNYRRARKGLLTVVNAPQVTPYNLSRAACLLAEMDLYGKGLNFPNYEEARKGFLMVKDNDQANPKDRAKATLYLAEMDRYGQGLHCSNYEEARKGFLMVKDNNQANPKDRAQATLCLAKMDFSGQGLNCPNYEEAHKGFLMVKNDEQANLKDRAQSSAYLEEMNFYGCGSGFNNFNERRMDFLMVKNNAQEIPEKRASARYFLAEMDYRGYGLPKPNYKNARALYMEIINNPDTPSEDIKYLARCKLEEMDRLGLGIPTTPSINTTHPPYESVSSGEKRKRDNDNIMNPQKKAKK